MSKLVVAPAARSDVFAQWDYFAIDVGQPDLADRFIACVELTFTTLGRMLGRGRSMVMRILGGAPGASRRVVWGVGQ